MEHAKVSTIQTDGIKLHIGGKEPRQGWSILNVSPGPHVEYVGNCNDLSFLPAESCSEVYASHVLEHLRYGGELQATLDGIYRVLKKDGRLRVSVPDLEILCRLFLHPKLKPADRFHIMRMMFGGHLDDHDVHYSGLTFEILGGIMRKAGFKNLKRVPTFDEFDDASSQYFAGVLISLNIDSYK